MLRSQAKRNSVVSETTMTDDGSSAFVTPLATPSELRDQFPSQLDINEDVQRTPQHAPPSSEYDDATSERSGTATPKPEERPGTAVATGRARGLSTASEQERTILPGIKEQRPTSEKYEEVEQKQEEEHRQEREIRELMVNTPEPPPSREPENAEGVLIPPSHEKNFATGEGKGIVEPRERPRTPMTAETQTHKDEERNPVPAPTIAPTKEATPAQNTALSSKHNISSTDTTLRSSSIKSSRRPSSSHSHPLKKQASQVSLAPGDPTGFTSGLAGGTGEKSSALATTTPAAESEADPNDETEYPGGLKLALITIGLALATFVIALDNTIIATAIPQITTVFNSLNDVGWYGSSYLLTTTSLQPTFGKIYSYFNVKWTYLTALVIFEVGSIICAAAVNSTMLIVGRAVAGAGAAALFSGAMTIIGSAGSPISYSFAESNVS